jgi:WD40 repeat protein
LFSFVGHNGIVKSLDFHPTEEALCSSDSDDEIIVWELNQKFMISSYTNVLVFKTE